MMDAKQKRVSSIMTTPPVLHDETQGRAAFIQATIFQAAKLKTPGQKQSSRPNHPRIRLKPRNPLDNLMHHPIKHVGRDTEPHPHTWITCNQQDHKLRTLLPACCQSTEDLE